MSTHPVSSAPDVDYEPYDSAEDEDFQLDAQDDSELSSDNETAEPAKKKRKTDSQAETPADEDLDSGDEATIRKAREKKAKRRRGKKGKGTHVQDDGDLDMDDEEGGTGGFVRTRAMKMRIHEERKPLAKIDGATVDVDALWAKMNAPDTDSGIPPSQIQQDAQPAPEVDHANTEMQDRPTPAAEESTRPSEHAEQMIKIKRTYKFAGEMITEEKVVPKDSAEAKAFLSGGDNAEYADANAVETVDAHPLRRPIRKISRFDPNPTGTIKKSWEKQPVAEADKDARGPKINTVEKSRLDWAAYVDNAGIKDELRVHSKAKEGYISRMDFLGRMEAKREDERRAARLKGM